jgi:2-haloacid dehalogenase
MTIRAVVFDAYGTLYDVQSVRRLATELCGDRGELITHLWRLKQLEYTWLRGLMQAYEDFSVVTRNSLDFALDRAGVPATPAIRDRLMKSYLDLDLYPETLQALKSLTEYKLAILSNGSPEMLDLLVEASGVRSLLDEVISVDQAKSYKPDPRCYELAPRTLGVAKHEVLFVSSNGFDVAGAKRFGFHVAWVERGGGAMPPSSSDVGPTELFRLLRGGAERLGLSADKRVEALTDLPRVLAELAK